MQKDKQSNFRTKLDKLKNDIFSVKLLDQEEQIHNERDKETIKSQNLINDFIKCSSFSKMDELVLSCNMATPKVKLNAQPIMKAFKDTYQVGKVLGEGAHAVVRQCWVITDPDDTFAVKITRSSDPEIMNIMKQTFLNTLPLNNPYIIKTYRLFIDPNIEHAYLVMEYLPYRSLDQLLKQQGKLNILEAQQYIRCIFQGVYYIHKMGICHRDLKPDNIIVDQETNTIKIIDFGVSMKFISQERDRSTCKLLLMWTITGNMYYQAPEIWRAIGYTAGIDIWSVGVMAYQMLCGKLPIDQETQMEYFYVEGESDKHWQEPAFKALPIMAQDFLRRLLKWDPIKRLSAQEALLHPWLYSNNQIKEQCKSRSNKFERRLLIKDDQFVGNHDLLLIPTKKSDHLSLLAQISVQQPQTQTTTNQDNCIMMFDDKIQNFKRNCFTDNFHILDQFTSQQIKDRPIEFQQSINISKPFMLDDDKNEFTDFFNQIQSCDSQSSFCQGSSTASVNQIPQTIDTKIRSLDIINEEDGDLIK